MLLLACAQPDAPAAGDDDAHVPYVAPETAPPTPALSAVELAGIVQDALAGVLAVDASPVLDAYDEAMAGSDTCPTWYTSGDTPYWYDSCTAASGATYSGYAYAVRYDAWDDGAGTQYDGRVLSGVGTVTTAAGATFSFGGSAYALTATPVGVDPADSAWTATYASVVQGTFAYDGPAAAGTWVAAGGSPDLSIVAYAAPAWDARYIAIDGGLSLAGGVASAVVLDTLRLASANLVPDCPGEPAGVVSVRDADGGWYDVLFDGPETLDAEVDPALCDGCGTAWYRGAPVGEVCVDFSPLLEWAEGPW